MKIQNFLILVILALVGFLYTHYMYSQTPFGVRPKTPIPYFSFTDLNGKTHYTRDFEGKTVILNFWASWCAPCVQEFPRLVELAERNQKNVFVIALSSDQTDEHVKNFITDAPNMPRTPNMIIARDSENITGQLFHVYKLPETLIIDKRLNLRKKFIGADWTVKDVEKAMTRL